MFNNLPETAMIYKYDKRYIVSIKNDSYEFYSEFTPYYEDDEDIGSYGSDIILDMMKVDSDQIKLDIKLMSSYLNQASLLASSDNYTITLTVSNNEIRLKDENVDCFIPMENKTDSDYSVTFKTKILKSVISNLDEESAFMHCRAPSLRCRLRSRPRQGKFRKEKDLCPNSRQVCRGAWCFQGRICALQGRARSLRLLVPSGRERLS